jgi:hypothetical protein
VILRPGYDLVVQYGGEVARDVQARVVNAAVLSDVALPSPLSRLLSDIAPPFQLRAQWAEPGVWLADGALALVATVQGGVRHVAEGINLSVGGEVVVGCRPEVAMTADGPMLTLAAPSPADLDLSRLRLVYAGGDELPPCTDVLIERALIRPALCEQLLAPLAGLPLNYLPAPFSPYLSEDAVRSGDWTAWLDRDADLLAVALQVTAATPRARPDRSGERRAVGQATAAQPDFLSGAEGANLALAIRIHTEGDTTEGDTTEGDTRVGASHQRFAVPGTGIDVEAILVDTVERDGYHVARYALPIGDELPAVTIEDSRPAPIIIQPIVPRQAAPGLPVITQLIAVHEHSTHLPYDYAWLVDDQPRPPHVSTLTLSIEPEDEPEDEPRDEPRDAVPRVNPAVLCTVGLRVIDMLGQVGEAEFEVRYHMAGAAAAVVEVDAEPEFEPEFDDEPGLYEPDEPYEPDELDDTGHLPYRQLQSTVYQTVYQSEPDPQHGDRTRRRRTAVIVGAAAAAVVAVVVALAAAAGGPPGGQADRKAGVPDTRASHTVLAELTAVPASAAPTPVPSASAPAVPSPSVSRTLARTAPATSGGTGPAVEVALITSAGACAPANACVPEPTCPNCTATFEGDCSEGVTVQFWTTISVSRGPTNVAYRWLVEGNPLDTQTEEFTGTGLQQTTIGQAVALYTTTKSWTAQAEAISPVAKRSNTARVSITCT